MRNVDPLLTGLAGLGFNKILCQDVLDAEI